MDTPTVAVPVAPVTPVASTATPDLVSPVTSDNINASQADGTPSTAKAPDVSASGNPEKPYKLKANGKEIELTLEELQTWAQKGMGANQKFQEAARMREQMQKIMQMIKTNPRAILEDPRIGVDIKKLAEDVLWEQVQREKMTPEQRELQETKKKLEEFEKQNKELESRTKTEKFNQEVEHFSKKLGEDIQNVLQTSNVPKTQFTVKRMAFYMQEALKRGVDLSAKDVVGIVHNEYQQNVKQILGAVDGDALVNLIGEDTLKKIRDHELKRLQGGGKTPTKLEVVGDSSSPRQPSGSSSKKLSPEEWKKDLEQRFGS